MLIIEPSPRPQTPRRTPLRVGLLWLLVAAAIVTVAVSLIWLPAKSPQLAIQPIHPQVVAEGQLIAVDVKPLWNGLPVTRLEYGMISGPSTATIDPRTGHWQWTPNDQHGGHKYRIKLGMRVADQPLQQAVCEFIVVVQEAAHPPSILPVADQSIALGGTLQVTIQARDPDVPAQPLTYRFGKHFPPGAKLDSSTGLMTWTVSERPPESPIQVQVEVIKEARPVPLTSRIEFQIRISDSGISAKTLVDELVASGLEMEPITVASESESLAAAKAFSSDGNTVLVLECESPTAAREAAAEFTPVLLSQLARDVAAETDAQLFCDGQLVVIQVGKSAVLQASLADMLGEVWISASTQLNSKFKSLPVQAEVQGPAADPQDLPYLTELARLYRAGTLCDLAQYPTLRRLAAARFTRRAKAQLAVSFQSSGELQNWLEQHPDLRDELYTAFDPADDINAALQIVDRLRIRSTSRLAADFELAIATAVTWDRETGIYDYSVQQRRSRATVSREKTCDAIDNFEYYSDPSFSGQRRIHSLPWEFLTHVVNHRTPLVEREWVQRTYREVRRPIGQCYEDVVYDHGMIKSNEQTSNLAPRAYTLPNLKDRGGICVMQADYAARVCQSLGIPAAYVEGRARSGGNHAWVVWTELQGPSTSGLAFSLESHGRFFIDRYYVGHLLEPQTGRQVTDRELELRLQGVGWNPLAYRQATLILQVWPELKAHLQLTPDEELDLLEKVTLLSPGHQGGWQALAQLARSSRLSESHRPRLDRLRDRCIKTFTNSPDFVCQIIDDLLAYDPDFTKRLPTYERLLQLWASTGRPDLTCRLRLQLTDHLVAQQQYQAALGGLAQTIKRFPDEGRFIPRLVDKYETVARYVDDGQAKVLKLYHELLPLIPRRRQSQSSPYYLEMLGRAARRFQEAGELKPAQAYADQLKKLQGK